ncbi:relaxase/mobilization nuclease (plasmid) [Cylindrospermum stagnale PCC 7417]|uniref:Relaxase/mobilization nuclease n=1 Tax=Cylindrospermum stagnale PCC 7417 TaxID=56107 RepID=K9X890_9NOST|nr:relaxase/mobilization nuclease domain-containing protein [Cylindrospermum stagnale]AFZ28291.1 relaxase/mobilization nuclease [Cylindrospermum stagnale PCC 7417]
MITKVKANKSFRGTTKYVLEKEKATIIGGNMYGSTTNELVEQFSLSAHLNPQLKDPCYHLMLSVPKTDRTLNDDELTNISQRHLANVIVLSRLKGEESQVKQPDKRIADTKLNQLVDEFIESELPAYDFFIARHSDKENDHTHIVASRVNNLDGKSIRTWNNYAYSEHSARLLEREFHLTPVQSSWESKRKAMTRNQLERVERDGLPGEEIMRRAIDAVAADKPTMPQLIERLWLDHQVKAIVSYYSHGGVRGIKFGINIGAVNEDGSSQLLWKQGGNLNKYKCSFNKLQTELGVSYDSKRDDSEIKRLTEMLESASIVQANQQVIDDLASNKPIYNSQIYSNKPEAKVENKPLLTQEQSVELYKQYSDGLQQELVTDRDKEIAVRALKDDRSALEVAEIIRVSPAGWTEDEARKLVLIASDKLELEQPNIELRQVEQPELVNELLAVAVPVGVELINRLLRNPGENSLRLKRATLAKEGQELVFTHDERGEVFRVAVSRNQEGNLEYSPVNIGEVRLEDIHTWREVKRALQQQMKEERQQKRTQTKGFSL